MLTPGSMWPLDGDISRISGLVKSLIDELCRVLGEFAVILPQPAEPGAKVIRIALYPPRLQAKSVFCARCYRNIIREHPDCLDR